MKTHCSYDKLVSVNDLKPHPKNRNEHPKDQIERLAKILDYQGWRYPIKVSKLSGFITSGHGRLAAARKLKLKEVPVNYQDYDNEAQEYADLQSDNAIALWAELDLSSINQDLGDLGPDFDVDWLGIKDFVLEPADKIPGADEDEVPEVIESKVVAGDLFILGNHRLLCGDSTNIQHVDRLMNGSKADMVFTDPPYGVEAVNSQGNVGVSGKTGWSKTSGEPNTAIYKKRSYKKIIGDDKPFEPGFIFPFSEKLILWGANYYSDKLPQGDKWLVWDKKDGGKGADGNNFSDCELAWTNFEGRSVRVYRHLWSGLLRSGDRNEELKERVHPTQKPVGLCSEIITEFSKINESILDLFGGSGSTLIACEKTNRNCFMMEIDPHYCAVILDRWEKYSGGKAVREDGKLWGDVKNGET